MNIIADDAPEPIEVIEVVLVCEMNCFLPQEVYTIMIADPLGQSSQFTNKKNEWLI